MKVDIFVEIGGSQLTDSFTKRLHIALCILFKRDFDINLVNINIEKEPLELSTLYNTNNYLNYENRI